MSGVSLYSPIEQSDRNVEGLAVFGLDRTVPVLDVPFLQDINETTLASDASIGDLVITLTAGHGAVAGNVIELADTGDGSSFMQAEVLSVATNDITLDIPVNKNYTTSNTTVTISTRNMAVNGSVTPQEFYIAPNTNQKGDMHRIIIAITDNADMDFETFGGIAALTNGVVLRVKNSDGSYRILQNFKTNGQFERFAFDARYFVNNGGGTRGFTCRSSFGGPDKHGAVIRLDGDLGERLELLVQDDLSALTSFTIIAQGSEVI